MQLSCAVVIPTFNNEQTITSVIDAVLPFCETIIVVNDGSTDNSSEILSLRSDITLLNQNENSGKGAALRRGFSFAVDNGFSHVITIDADGEHNPEEIPRFLEKMSEEPETLWVGARPIHSGEKNRMRYIHRFIGNSGIRIFAGFTLSDCFSGFRLYPLSPTSLACKSNRIDYEQEVLLESAWSGVELKEFDLEMVVLPDELKGAHYHPLKDVLRILRVHIKAMVTRFLNPFSSLKVEGNTTRQKVKNLVKQELLNHTTPLKAAIAFSLGVFMGIFPVHGFQVVTLMFLATKFRLNRPIAYLGVNVSAPPFIPFLILGAIKLGDVFLPGVIDTSEIDDSMIKKGGVGFAAFLLGSAMLAPIGAVIAFIISYPIFSVMNIRRPAQKREEA